MNCEILSPINPPTSLPPLPRNINPGMNPSVVVAVFSFHSNSCISLKVAFWPVFYIGGAAHGEQGCFYHLMNCYSVWMQYTWRTRGGKHWRKQRPNLQRICYWRRCNVLMGMRHMLQAVLSQGWKIWPVGRIWLEGHIKRGLCGKEEKRPICAQIKNIWVTLWKGVPQELQIYSVCI